ncbi:diacylglycerol/lipid kinase family protein [Arthrobacter sp. HLT1-21]
MQLRLIFLIALALVAAGSVASWRGVRRLHFRKPPAPDAAPPLPAPTDRQRVALVVHPGKPHAGLARDLVELACVEAGWDPPLVFETSVSDPGFGQASQALREGSDVVIAAGGDGTVRAVARAMAHQSAMLGLIPLGTGNLLARNLGVPVSDLATSVRHALHGGGRRIDMGRVKLLDDRTGSGTEHVFLVMGGVGLDAVVVAATRDVLKEKLGWLAYSEAGFRSLPGKRQRMGISLDGQPSQVRTVHSVLFANCGRLPGGIELIPDSTLDDGYLDVVVMSPRSILGWIWMGAKIVLRPRSVIPVINYYQARSVTVTVSEPTQTQLDGDLSGVVTSVTVSIDPGALIVRSLPAPASQRTRPVVRRTRG